MRKDPMEKADGENGPLPMLADDGSKYEPHSFPYVPKRLLVLEQGKSKPSLEDWMAIFYNSIPYFQGIAGKDPSIEDSGRRREMAETFAKTYRSDLDGLMGRIKEDNNTIEYPKDEFTCLNLCRLREQALRRAGFKDPFLLIKKSENEKALEILPDVCKELDDCFANPENRGHGWLMVVKNICAANIFDLGSAHTTKMYHDGGVQFHDTRESLLQRPWVIDDADAFCHAMRTKKYTKAILFVDNAGSDVILGMMPFARQLLSSGTAENVVIAANSLPSINDITYSELEAILPEICQKDDKICDFVSRGVLRLVASGNDLPVIDLSRVSKDVCDEAETADLVVLEGMGRSIETNLYAGLRCDSLNIGMVKHQEVADVLGGRMLDCVVRFQTS